MKIRFAISLTFTLAFSSKLAALSMAPEEFHASRAMACVLAEQALGQIDELQYGERWHRVLDGFEAEERTTILAKALGYYDGLMFDIADTDTLQINRRLEMFIASDSCSGGYEKVVFHL
ncbi:MAG: hypothetical protein AB8B81_03245 [Halioglobus sp.]